MDGQSPFIIWSEKSSKWSPGGYRCLSKLHFGPRQDSQIHDFMKIYIKCPNTPSDWFIIELQGEVSIDGEDESFNPSGLKFGDISESNVRVPFIILFSSWNDFNIAIFGCNLER